MVAPVTRTSARRAGARRQVPIATISLAGALYDQQTLSSRWSAYVARPRSRFSTLPVRGGYGSEAIAE